MKRWECTVCGYIHEGDEPPEVCPVCGADKSKFILLPDEADAESAAVDDGVPEPTAEGKTTQHGFVVDMILKHHLHPITVHVPNGVAPLAVAFLGLHALFNIPVLASTAFFNVVAIFLSMPLALFTGFIEWQYHYGGKMTSWFRAKIIAACVVAVLAGLLVLWRLMNPEVSQWGTLTLWLYLFGHLLMLAPVGVAGFIGGKFVFKD
jgi:rubredoxin